MIKHIQKLLKSVFGSKEEERPNIEPISYDPVEEVIQDQHQCSVIPGFKDPDAAWSSVTEKLPVAEEPKVEGIKERLQEVSKPVAPKKPVAKKAPAKKKPATKKPAPKKPKQ